MPKIHPDHFFTISLDVLIQILFTASVIKVESFTQYYIRQETVRISRFSPIPDYDDITIILPIQEMDGHL